MASILGIAGATADLAGAVRSERDARDPLRADATRSMGPCPYPVRCTSASASAPPVPRGLPLVIALTGFTDAGSAVSRLVDYFRDELDPTPLAVFSNDVLLDYRARRPVISFEQDHLTDYRPPRLELSLVHDSLGQPFLLLAGYEPDFAWDAFTAAVLRVRDGASTSRR